MVFSAADLGHHSSLLGLFFDLSSGAISLWGSEDQEFACLRAGCKSSTSERWVESGNFTTVRWMQRDG